MTDFEWESIREKWKKKVKDGDLRCGENFIPFGVTPGTKIPWQWVSREYVEDMQSIAKERCMVLISKDLKEC